MKSERTSSSLRRAALWLAVLGASFAMIGACKQETKVAPEPASSGSGGSASGGAGGASPGRECPSGKGPAMALLPATDGSKYCMDVRETTRAEYDAFVKAKAGGTSGQPALCSWNTSFTPTLVSQDADTFPSPYYCYDSDWNNMRPDQAVSCVDFCDALAYCQWAGKRLCGRVGKGADSVDQFAGTLQDFTTFIQTVAKSPQSEFINACTQEGKTAYPYGDTYQPGVCIDQTWVQQHGATALDVTNTASRQCHGSVAPFNGVYDLSGGVTEWQNVCYQQAGWSCLLSGSPWNNSPATSQACADYVGATSMEQVATDLGFRCCADPVR